MRKPGEVVSELLAAYLDTGDDMAEIIRRRDAEVLRWAADQLDRFADDRNAAAELRHAADRLELQRVWNTPEAREYIDGLRGDPDSRETLPEVRAEQKTLRDGEVR